MLSYSKLSWLLTCLCLSVLSCSVASLLTWSCMRQEMRLRSDLCGVHWLCI